MEPKLFILTNPIPDGHMGSLCWLYTGNQRLVTLARQFEGIASTTFADNLNNDGYHVLLHFSLRYDHETVWLMLYEELERESRLDATWSDAIDEVL